MSNIAAPSERPPALAAAPVVVVRGRRTGSLAWNLIGLCVIASLSGFNAWWYWRDTRPLPDLNTISAWMQREQYAQAEPVLHEHLRRSPHDGEARMMLARVLAGSRRFSGLRPAVARGSFLVAGESRGTLSRGTVVSSRSIGPRTPRPRGWS